MKSHRNMIAAVSIVLHFAIFITILTKSIFGHELLHRSNNGGDHDVPIIERDDSEVHRPKLTYRFLDLDTSTSCSNACDADRLKQFRAPFLEVEIVDKKESSDNHGFFSHLFGRISGLFQFFKIRRCDADDRKAYLIPTEPIIELLSNSSAQILSLVDLLRLEGRNTESSSTSEEDELVPKLYDLSAENMESVASLINTIVADVQQSNKIEIRTLGCHMIDLSNLLSNITSPNIEFLTQQMYPNNRFYDETEFHATATQSSSTAASGKRDDVVCSVCDASSSTRTASTTLGRRFTDLDLGSSTTGRQSTDFAVSLPLLILFFPLSFVVSIVGIIITIVFLPLLLLLIAVAGDGFSSVLFLGNVIVFLGAAILAPIITLVFIVDRVIGIFQNTVPPMEEASPTNMMTSVPPTSVNKSMSKIRFHILSVLESPLDRIKAFVFQNENTFQGIDKYDQYDMECELAMFQCQNMALSDVLPF